jgi:hypothetical protein
MLIFEAKTARNRRRGPSTSSAGEICFKTFKFLMAGYTRGEFSLGICCQRGNKAGSSTDVLLTSTGSRPEAKSGIYFAVDFLAFILSWENRGDCL